MICRVHRTRANPVIVNEVSLSPLSLSLIPRGGNTMHTQYSPLLSPLSPRCRGSCSYNSQWFWRCSGGGGGDISPLQFPNSEERPSAVTAESGAAAAAAAALSQTDPIQRLPSEKNGNRVISERTTPSASVSDNITCEQSMLSPHRFTTQGAAITKSDVRTFFSLNDMYLRSAAARDV